MNPGDSIESAGHIQCYCPAVHHKRIAIHHGMCRKLMFSIRKSSTELDDEKEPRWHFTSALSPEAHAEWGLYKILEYMGLHEILPRGEGQNKTKLKKKHRRIPPSAQHQLRNRGLRNLYLPQTKRTCLRQRREIRCILRIRQSNGHQCGLGHTEGNEERQYVQLTLGLHQAP